MKTILMILAGLCMPVLAAVAQTLNHPVIEKVQAFYKPVSGNSVTANTSGAPDLKVKATVNVVLKAGHNAVKVHMKVRNKQNNTTVYEVNYLLSSAEITDNGLVLFKKQGEVVTMTNPGTVSLMPYVYELYTEDSAGNKSNLYMIIQ